MSFYDYIAQSWHRATGYEGGSFKKHVLNDVLLQKIAGIANKEILELGAGNGYFMPLALRHFSDQAPKRIVISDQSAKLLAIAESHFFIANAKYLRLDVRSPFPFEENAFDLILATMVFNEVTYAGLVRALFECNRVMKPDGMLLVSLTHPDFIASLERRDQLRKNKDGILTMPGAQQMRLPIVPRRTKDYEKLLKKTGYTWQATDIFVTNNVINEKPGLHHMRNKPLGLVLECRKSLE